MCLLPGLRPSAGIPYESFQETGLTLGLSTVARSGEGQLTDLTLMVTFCFGLHLF
jgi:hypothetical protein